MKKQSKIILALGVGYALALTGGTLYNLADTFLIEHAVAAESTSSDTSETSASNDGTTSGNASSAESSSASATSSPYSTTSVSYSKKSAKNGDGVTTAYHLVDIKLASYDDLKSHLATNSSGSYGVNIRATASSQVSSVTSSGETVLAAINGDFCYASSYRKGYVIRNGKVLRSSSQDTTSSNKTGRTSGDCFATFSDGTAKAFLESTTTTSALLNEGCFNCWCFGPKLVSGSSITVTSSEEVYQAMGSNERSAIGYLGAYHFVFFVSEGRLTSNDGFSLYETAQLLKNYGCSEAYNLDGGGSSELLMSGSIKNAMSASERSLGDIIYVKAS